MFNREELARYKWKDVVVSRTNSGDAILIVLIFDDMATGNLFVDDYLSAYSYEFLVSKDERTGMHSFSLNFEDFDYSMKLDTQITNESYPPISWLGSGEPAFISHGAWQNIRNEKGNQFLYNPDLLPIDDQMKSISLEESIANAFSRALRIEFWPSTKDNEPEMVILVFDRRQAVTAYNDLHDIASSTSTFLKLGLSDTVAISFIDAVENFHITIPSLNYDKAQLNTFKDSLGENHPFGFVLGLDNPGADRPILLSTTNDFKIITLAGHI